MEQGDSISIADHERETRAIGQLIRNFEKVSGLEPAEEVGRDSAAVRKHSRQMEDDTGDAERLRLELAERILRLRELKSAND